MAETPETSGMDLLELYIKCIGGPEYLDRDEKIVLRLCCKKIKNVIDPAITKASIRNNEDLCALLQRNWALNCLYISGGGENDPHKPSPETLLASAIDKFPTLESLTLYMGNLTELPESIGKLTSLIRIKCWFPLQGLPTSISKLTKLETILFPDLCCEVKLKIRDMALLKDLNNLKTFHIQLSKDEDNGNSDEDVVPQELPDYISSHTALTELHFGASFPCSLPNAFGNLKQLQYLHLNFNYTDRLPESLGELSSLEQLVLYYNKGLKTLPDSIGQLSALTELHLCACVDFEAFPETLGQLKNLEVLELIACGSLVSLSLPSTIGNLSSLRQLKFIECTSLTWLPDSIENLDSLQVLEFDKCDNFEPSPAVERLLLRIRMRQMRVETAAADGAEGV